MIATTMTVPLHAERTADPRVVRWITTVLAASCLSETGTVLGHLVERGLVAEVAVGGRWIDVRCTGGQDWLELGEPVRRALDHEITAAVAAHGAGDAVLRTVASCVLEQQVGELARTHGGSLEVLEARDGVVTVGRAGACGHCPAAEVTVHRMFEAALRAEIPTVVGVRSSGHRPEAAGRRTLLGLPGLRRR
jgi:NFU1 iron-sulfur cluster scaffold homolog, mitochondrial